MHCSAFVDRLTCCCPQLRIANLDIIFISANVEENKGSLEDALKSTKVCLCASVERRTNYACVGIYAI